MSRDAQSERKKLLLLCIPITMGLGYIYYGWTSLQDARTSVNWPVTPGTIVNSRVETHTTDGETYDSTTVEYVYTVDGVEYSSDVVRFGAPRPGAGSLSQYFSRRPDLPSPGSRESPMYPVGKAVSVSYEPSNVTNAVLEPGGESYDFLYLGGVLALVPLLAGLGINTLHRVQHAEPTGQSGHALFHGCGNVGRCSLHSELPFRLPPNSSRRNSPTRWKFLGRRIGFPVDHDQPVLLSHAGSGGNALSLRGLG